VTDVHIGEVHTDLQITESVGALGPAEVRKLVALVMAQIKAQQHNDALRESDNRLQNGAYISNVTE
jgi:hypothetical protein